MNKEQRREWIDIGWVLCSWCRYAEWTLDKEECRHPLEGIRDSVCLHLGMDVGVDCWGFIPIEGLTLDEARVAAWHMTR